MRAKNLGQCRRRQKPIFEFTSVYGRENAWLYYQKIKLLESFVDAREHESFAKHVAFHGIWGFATGSLFRDFSHLPLPGFSVDPDSSKTVLLREKYSIGRQKVIEYFDRKHFLDATLQLLTQPLEK